VEAAQRQRAEWIRTAPEREASAKAEQVAYFFKGIVGLVVGTILGWIAGYVAASVIVFLVVVVCNIGNCPNWNTGPNEVFKIIVGLVTVIGAYLGWWIGRE
jgi:F0F1-type ATP synthase assembly protein I